MCVYGNFTYLKREGKFLLINENLILSIFSLIVVIREMKELGNYERKFLNARNCNGNRYSPVSKHDQYLNIRITAYKHLFNRISFHCNQNQHVINLTRIKIKLYLQVPPSSYVAQLVFKWIYSWKRRRKKLKIRINCEVINLEGKKLSWKNFISQFITQLPIFYHSK